MGSPDLLNDRFELASDSRGIRRETMMRLTENEPNAVVMLRLDLQEVVRTKHNASVGWGCPELR